MVQNWFTDAMKNWNNMTNEQKVVVLQNAENYASRLQKRNPRRVVTHNIMRRAVNDRTVACYSPQLPGEILMIKFDLPFLSSVSTIFHEGVHASIDDYILNKKNLNLYMKIDAVNLKQYIRSRKLLYDYFKYTVAEPLYELKIYEEQIANMESSIMTFKLVMESCETIAEVAESFNGLYNEIFLRLLEIKLYADSYEREHNINFYAECKKACNYYSNRLDNITTKKNINCGKDEDTLFYFNKIKSLVEEHQINGGKTDDPRIYQIVENGVMYNQALQLRKIFE